MIFQIDSFYANGHANISGKHKTTIEFTKERHVTSKGDCIIGINATKSLLDLNPKLKNLIRSKRKITCLLQIDGLKEKIIGWGHPDLSLTNPISMVIRKSNYICGRTLMIGANKAARDINREIIERLKNPNSKMKIIISA
ncbi:MAG: DUF371 domain-containing protein [Candidatus Helarchaeota archaeon]